MLYIYLVLLILSLMSSWTLLWKVPKLRVPEQNSYNKRLSIIIPARNEETNLPILLESLRKQRLQPIEIIVVDDDSDDQTVKVAEEYGAKTVQLQNVNTEWVGKSAGCWEGAKESTGNWLLFLDADSYLPLETSLDKVIQTFDAQEGKGILSLQPYHEIKNGYENLSVLFNIMVLAGMNRFSILGKKLNPAGAFGPSLLCSRELYFEIGGHKSVKDSIMENIDLGKKVLDKNLPVSLFSGKGSLHFRMYPDGLHNLSQGWSKSFASASGSSHPFIIIGTIFLIAGAFVTFLGVLFALVKGGTLSIIITLAGYLLYYLHFLRMARIAGDFSPIALLFYPLVFLFFISIYAWSFINTFFFKTVEWKGRKIDV